MTISPDTKDWTWVLRERCPDCGLDAGSVPLAQIGPRIREATSGWTERLGRPDVALRPELFTWSPLEYGAHVRDVLTVMRGRLHLMLENDDPGFPNWDQDRAAVDGKYDQADPKDVAAAIAANTELLSSDFAAVPEEHAGRTGLRSNGSRFTVLTLGQYALHDLVHHAWDVREER